jgi:hypothetical protein
MNKINSDKINPDHYKNGNYETIDVIMDTLTNDGFLGYLEGNTLKYLSRWRHKNGVEDLKKAEWYLKKTIEVAEMQKKEI